MDTALLVVVMSFFALVGAAIAGGLLTLGATRAVRAIRQRSETRLLRPAGRESIH